MKKHRRGIIITLFVLIIGFIINYYFNPYAKRFYALENEIPQYRLLTMQDSINSRIASVFSTRGFGYITMQDGQKVAVTVSRNGLYEHSFIGDFLMAGDSLYKASGMDTFYVYRDQRVYYFVVGKIVNEN